jgi:signal transduction histidine kinase
MSELNEDFLALLAHELRTPVAAIIGYHDLMSEGILGDVNPRVAEAIDRIRNSANQLLALVAGLGEISVADPKNLHVELDDEDPREIVESTLAALAAEALGRATTVTVKQLPESGTFTTDRERVQRALLLALHAAIKNTAGGELTVEAAADDVAFTCIVHGANLEAVRDDARAGSLDAKTAAGMRLTMAAHAISPLGGTIDLASIAPDTTITIRVPRAGVAD